jgi:hypothetical protein
VSAWCEWRLRLIVCGPWGQQAPTGVAAVDRAAAVQLRCWAFCCWGACSCPGCRSGCWGGARHVPLHILSCALQCLGARWCCCRSCATPDSWCVCCNPPGVSQQQHRSCVGGGGGGYLLSCQAVPAAAARPRSTLPPLQQQPVSPTCLATSRALGTLHHTAGACVVQQEWQGCLR